ncbi:MAG: hypothetical protein ACI9XO_004570, partial [Paraglaciecola sp.]
KKTIKLHRCLSSNRNHLDINTKGRLRDKSGLYKSLLFLKT